MSDTAAPPAAETSDRAARDREDRAERDRENRAKARGISEHELLNWTRMAMALTSTGIAANRALALVEGTETRFRIDPLNLLKFLALALVVLGLGILCIACIQHVRLLLALKRNQPPPVPVVPISLVAAVGIIAIFLTALVTVLTSRDDLQRTPRPAAAPPAVAVGDRGDAHAI